MANIGQRGRIAPFSVETHSPMHSWNGQTARRSVALRFFRLDDLSTQCAQESHSNGDPDHIPISGYERLIERVLDQHIADLSAGQFGPLAIRALAHCR